MSALAFTDCKVYVQGYDLSGQLNQAALTDGVELLDATTFGATTRTNAAGLRMVNAAIKGLWDSSAETAPDPVLFSRVGTADIPVVMVPKGATVGNTAFLFRCAQAEYNIGGELGQLKPFDVKLLGSGGQPLVRGALAHAGSASGDVTGTAIQLGAVDDDPLQHLYAVLHVFSGTGDFTVKVQSDSASNFATPTDQITFTQVGTATPIASQWATRVAGPITDDWWRIVATNPNTRDFAVAFGIRIP
jgi:hypothetical protein